MRAVSRILAGVLCLMTLHGVQAQMDIPGPVTQPAFQHGAEFKRRMAAIEMLGRRRDHRATPELVKSLADADPAIRAQAAIALGRVRAPEGVLPLVQALSDPAAEVRDRAAEALSVHSGEALEPATERIGEVFRTAENGQRKPLAVALAKIRTARAATILFTTLADQQYYDMMDAVVRHYEFDAPGAYALDALLTALQQPDFPQRYWVAYWVGATGEARAIDPLLAAIRSPDAELRADATGALGFFRADPRIAPALRALVKDTNVLVRSAAINTLGTLGDPVDIPILLEAMKDPHRNVRAVAIMQLQTRTDPRIPSLLVQALADTDRYVCWCAARALIARNDPAVLPDVRAVLAKLPAEQANPAQTVEHEFAGKTRDGLFALLTEYGALSSSQDKQRSIELSNYFISHRVECRDFVLAALAKEQPPALRIGALRAEQSITDLRALPLILAALHDEAHPEVSNAAINTLACAREDSYSQDEHLGMQMTPRRAHGWYSGRGPERPLLRAESLFADPRLVEPLIARAAAMDQTTLLDMDSLNPDMRGSLIRLLGWTGDPRAANALAELLQAPAISVRTAAAYALASCDDPRAADPLLAALRASDGQRLEETLAIVLSRMREPRVRDMLIEIARTHPQPKVRQSACLALGFTDDARAVGPLIDIMLDDHTAEVREFVAFALGQLADTGAEDPLIDALRDPVEWARSAAACALGQIGDFRAAPALAEAAHDPDYRFRHRVGVALARVGDPGGFSLLGADVLGTDQQYAYRATRFLGEFHDPRAVDALCPALDIKSYYLDTRKAAIGGLGQIGGARATQVLLDLQAGDDNSYSLPIPRALIATGDPRTADAVLAILQHSRYPGLDNAIEAAGLSGDPRMVAPLEAMLDDRHPNVARALVRLGSERGLPLLLAEMQKNPGSADDVCHDAARHPWSAEARAKIIAALVAELGETSITRVSAARALMAFGDPRGAAMLLATYRAFPRGATHEAARTALEELDPGAAPDVLRELMGLLPEARDARREELLYLLGTIAAHHPKAEALRALVPQLTADLEQDDPRLREAAARALGSLGDARAIPPLLDRLADPASRVREQTLIALGHTPDPEHRAIVPLIALCRDEPSLRLRAVVVAALHDLTGQTFGEDAAQWAAWWEKQK